MQRFVASAKVTGRAMAIGVNHSDVEVRSEPLGSKCGGVQSSDMPRQTRSIGSWKSQDGEGVVDSKNSHLRSQHYLSRCSRHHGPPAAGNLGHHLHVDEVSFPRCWGYLATDDRPSAVSCSSTSMNSAEVHMQVVRPLRISTSD